MATDMEDVSNLINTALDAIFTSKGSDPVPEPTQRGITMELKHTSMEYYDLIFAKC
jgi:hypothetical protein